MKLYLDKFSAISVREKFGRYIEPEISEIKCTGSSKSGIFTGKG